MGAKDMSSDNGFTHKTAQASWTLPKGALYLIGNNPGEMRHAKEHMYGDQLIRELLREEVDPEDIPMKRRAREHPPPGKDSDISHKSQPFSAVPYP